MNLTSIPKLDELVADSGKVSAVPPEAIAALRGELARLDTLLLARLFSGSNSQAEPGPDRDRLLTAKEAGETLGRSEDTMYRHADCFPFTVRDGRQVRFSQNGIAKYIRQRMGK